MFGCGSIRVVFKGNQTRKTAYRWEVSGKGAVVFLEIVRPYLREKAHQADLMITLVRYPPSAAIRKRMIEELKAQKRINYGPA
jgi:hypothetical protein